MFGLQTLFQVMDKLAKINKLKEEAAGGKQLEKNQLEMIQRVSGGNVLNNHALKLIIVHHEVILFL